MSARWYGVASRNYGYTDPFRPPEYCRYFVYARAATAKRAKVIALRWFRRHEPHYSQDADDAYENPFAGMVAERMP